MIQSGMDGLVPIFCIPGAGGTGTEFINLAGALGTQALVYALQPRGVDGENEPHTTVEAAAADYVRTIDATHRDAPVHLIGHSFGGWVAFELALRLGRSRAMSLTLIDSEPPRCVTGEWAHGLALERYVRTVECSSGIALRIDPNMFGALDEEAGIVLIHQRLVMAGILPRRSRPEVLRGPIRTFDAALRTSYVPAAILSLDIHLGLASEPRLDPNAIQSSRDDAQQGWRVYAPNLKLWYGPGDHFSILRLPHVQVLAEWWLRSINPYAQRSGLR
jgi:thioesterase domain-containing protein